MDRFGLHKNDSFYSNYNDTNFPDLLNSFVKIHYNGASVIHKFAEEANVYRQRQLPFNQRVFEIRDTVPGFKTPTVGLYKQFTNFNNNHLDDYRIAFSFNKQLKNGNNVSIGPIVGYTQKLIKLVDSMDTDSTLNVLGAHLSWKNDRTSATVQLMKNNKYDLTLLHNFKNNYYFGISSTNCDITDKETGSVFISNITKNNHKYIIGANIIADKHVCLPSMFCSISGPFTTQLGKAKINVGCSVNDLEQTGSIQIKQSLDATTDIVISSGYNNKGAGQSVVGIECRDTVDNMYAVFNYKIGIYSTYKNNKFIPSIGISLN
jgi:hypothetical protein